MITWSLSAEFFALIVNLILILSFYDRRHECGLRGRLCLGALWLTVCAILLDMVCVFTLVHIQAPLWLNLLLNSIYLMMITTVSTILAHYIICLLMESVYDPRCVRPYRYLLSLPLAAYLLLLIANAFNGLIFYLNEDGLYQRGPWINSGYLVTVLDLVILGICAWKYKRYISPPIRRVMKIIPLIALLLISFQILYPNVLFNGSIAASINLILFLNLQSRRVETDDLTYLGNRKSFCYNLTLIAQNKKSCQLIAISLKNFSAVNRRFGSRNADTFLYQVAQWLDNAFPAGRAFRTANLKFVLILPYLNEEAANADLERLTGRFCREWTLGEERTVFHAQFSQLICHDQTWTPEEMIDFLEAGVDMAHASMPVVQVDSETRAKLKAKKSLLQLIRESIQEHRFQTWYQPLYRCSTQGFDSAEALLRLQDRNGTPVSPTQFIPVAEQNGLIDDLSWIVLEDTCRLLGSPEGQRLRTVSINLSMQQFTSDDLIQRITNCLIRYHVPAERLRIEITERMLAQDPSRMRHIMIRLSSLGIRFYLDDFGTGYSNLSSILSLPISCVKLDRSVLSGFPDDQRCRTMVKTLINLFHDMGCQVVAEGVETQAQAETLILMGVDRIQGFYYAVPMPQDPLCAFLGSAQPSAL